jgi:hypothetical protein
MERRKPPFPVAVRIVRPTRFSPGGYELCYPEEWEAQQKAAQNDATGDAPAEFNTGLVAQSVTEPAADLSAGPAAGPDNDPAAATPQPPAALAASSAERSMSQTSSHSAIPPMPSTSALAFTSSNASTSFASSHSSVRPISPVTPENASSAHIPIATKSKLNSSAGAVPS